MGNYLNSSHSEDSAKRGNKRKCEDDTCDTDYDGIEEELLNTPKRRKLTTTSEYIYDTLYVNGEKSDVKICALGKEWKLHKIYLCQCGYFAGMFTRQWKESEDKVIHIEIPDENVSIDALDLVFGSLYKDEVMIKPSMVVQVLAAATLFSLEGLIQQCVSVITETISARTVYVYHTASVMYGQVKLTDICRSWIQNNVMLCQDIELLRDLDPDLMAEVISSPDLVVMQVEMDIYTMLKKWLFLKLNPKWAGSVKDLGHDAEEFFKGYTHSDSELLDTSQAQPYSRPFKSLRLCHIIYDLLSVTIIEEDNIMPKAWLLPIYRTQWLRMLQIEQGFDNGPCKPKKYSSIFSKSALRCGRMLEKDGHYCWRWTGYNFGFDLLVSFTSRLILIKRNALSQECRGAVGMQSKRHILYKITVLAFNKLGQTTYRKSTGLKHLCLGKDQEQIIFGVDRKADFPLYITASFLMYTPRDETCDPDGSTLVNTSSSRNNSAETSASDSDLLERDSHGDNDSSFDHQ